MPASVGDVCSTARASCVHKNASNLPSRVLPFCTFPCRASFSLSTNDGDPLVLAHSTLVKAERLLALFLNHTMYATLDCCFPKGKYSIQTVTLCCAAEKWEKVGR